MLGFYAPCKDCEERKTYTKNGKVITCHSSCEKYLKFKEKIEMRNKKARDESFARSITYETMMCAWKRGGGGRK